MRGGCRRTMSFRRCQRNAERTEAPREIGEEGVGSGLGEAPLDVDGLLGCGEHLLAASEVREIIAEAIHASRQIGEEVVGLVWARRRKMSTASWDAASACSRRPSVAKLRLDLARKVDCSGSAASIAAMRRASSRVR
jgi:hypothetical protein